MAIERLNTALHSKLIHLAAEAEGFSASELTGYSPEQVRRAAEALVADGRIVRSRVSPRRVRYFKDETTVQRYLATRGSARPAQSVGGVRARAAWAADEPGRITAKTKIYVAPPLPRDVYRTNTYPQF